MTLFRLAPLLIVLVILGAACGSPEKRIKERQAAFDAYPVQVQSQIQNGRIDYGFTEEMVYLAKGKPAETETHTVKNGKSRIVWKYRGSIVEFPGNSASTGLAGPYGYPEFSPKGAQPVQPMAERKLRKVEFEDGKVVTWDEELQSHLDSSAPISAK